ncbi:MAG: hypothetical protein CSB34_07280 [Desulfobulbus propionicus]|nr:MAG: hypothetical protein CSB34_07280 [Desulfobulbus propionicus]
MFGIYFVTNKPYWYLGLVHIGRTKQYFGIKENMECFWDIKLFKDVFMGGLLNSANKMTIIQLPLIKQMVGLIPSVQYTCLARLNNFTDKRTLSSVAFGEKEFTRYTVIQVKAKVQFCFVRMCSILCSVHGKH